MDYSVASNYIGEEFVHQSIQLFNILKTFLTVFTIVSIITLIPTLYMMYKKENIKPWYAFIPFFNVYDYFRILNIPFYLIFIPIVNLITLYFANYRLAKVYNTEKYISVLSFIIPFITTPYIIFSNKYNLPKKVDRRVIKSIQDVDKIEERLINENNNSYDITNNVQTTPLDDSYESNIDHTIEQIESNAITDDFYEDLLYMENNSTEATQITNENIETIDEIKDSIVDIQDIIDSNDIRVEGISSMEEKIEAGSQKDIIDNSNYKEYKEEQKGLSTIAFGGTNKDSKEENYKTESKEHNRCPYCKSILDINSKTCPGCGRDVSNLVFEK